MSGRELAAKRGLTEFQLAALEHHWAPVAVPWFAVCELMSLYGPDPMRCTLNLLFAGLAVSPITAPPAAQEEALSETPPAASILGD